MRRLSAALAALILAAVTAAVVPLAGGRANTAAAHPLGNFTVNRYARIELGPDTISVRYVVDMAEIPAFQEEDALDTDGDGDIGEAERAAYSGSAARQIAGGLDLRVGDRAIDLTSTSASVAFPPGQGGLDTLRLEIDYVASMPAGWADARPSVTFRDGNDTSRLGWREIVVRASAGVALEGATVPETDITNELRAYPSGALSNPLDMREATFGVAPGDGSAAPLTAAPGTTIRARGGDAFTALAGAEKLSPLFIAGALAIAFGFGALHALGPGHGKTIVAAYLVGERGRPRHALLLGLTVTATHTSSVFALALVTLFASQFIVPERLYPWLTLVSGLSVVVVGASVLLSRLRGAHTAAHDHDHAAADGPVTLRSLLLLGVSGGIVPCPSALVVLLGAISLHRVAMGLALVTAFSFGLAFVLSAIGLALVWTKRALAARRGPADGQRRGLAAWAQRVAPLLPTGSAIAIVGVGMVITVRAVSAGLGS